MNYKKYEAAVHYSEDDQIFWGEVVNISSPTTILFEAENAKDLERAFHQSIDAYLDICQQKGKEPKKPMSGKFLLRINPQKHAKLSARVLSENTSINQWVSEAIDERLEGTH